MRQFVDRWRRFAWIGNIVGFLMFIVGIPSLSQDIGAWGHWLSRPGWLHWLRRFPLGWVADQGAWWAFVATGLLIIFLSNLPALLQLFGQSELAARLGLVTTAPVLPAEAAAVIGSRPSPFTGVHIVEPVLVPPEEAKMEHDINETTAEDSTAGEAHETFSQEGYEERFGVLWIVSYVPRSYAGIFAGLNSILDAPVAVKVDGPFCPNDGTALRFKDRHGDRHLMDEDDISASGGSLYCSQCGAASRPDPNYSGARPLSVYRNAVKKEFEN